MVTTAGDYTVQRYRAMSPWHTGVVFVSYAGYAGTGAVLYDGRAILTAAHLFDARPGTGYITFLRDDGTSFTSPISGYQIHPDYEASNLNHDLAIVWLRDPAPPDITRYDIYREGDELGRAFEFVGFGQPGTGLVGHIGRVNAWLRLKANNRFDADGAELKAALGAGMAWAPRAGVHLMADFDSGWATNDALGVLLGRDDLGLGLEEGIIAPGDSGGPAFIDRRIAGVASYGASLSYGFISPDIDSDTNATFGEIAAWQRVSVHQQWIDQSLRAGYPEAPAHAEDVQRTVREGDTGTRYAYFLLEFTGERAHPEQMVSVDYATRDGTARAGQDYLPVTGTLRLYPGETRAVIPVEIIGDTVAEEDETFYMDVFNPVGGSFGTGVAKLTAMRTIVDDDVGWL
ncbi:Calx-beta domain-containing protein [Tepidimonas charontis]|uniref:Caca: sodium/calcium exchanger 1 n=1 Tax=Tepidimonas charontis TaxID=2267262 RepID=A0A554XC90_9BURK|nr:Calx-beta domain-containing protein [Tepidimonas charontis]TSE33457.1 caca: sodium/calcium exchanger 1 [Tepidimonas charontis]